MVLLAALCGINYSHYGPAVQELFTAATLSGQVALS